MKLYIDKENNLAIKYPELAKQWHNTKNGILTPRHVTTGSGKKVWWKCEKGHEWEATVGHRANGRGCPYCAGKRASVDNCLQILKPSLAKEWHPTKNGDLTPSDVKIFSNKKVWWLCEKGHEYEAVITGRTQGSGCPFCTGKRACSDNSLQTLNPELSEEWHPIKNGSLTPNDVTKGTHKKIWWICEKGHEWETSIHNRLKGTGCPYCSGRRARIDNSLQTLNPELSKEWHPTKNGKLTPDDVTTFSNQKIWWQCKKGHEWKTTVEKRPRGQGCPFCSGQRVCIDNCLHTLNPFLAKEWHPTKNGTLTPHMVTTGANKKVWWQCEKGHEWEAIIADRSNGRNCPICNQGTQTSFPEQAIYYYILSCFNDAINRYKYNNKWEIDVYVPSLNFGIEYDGLFYHQKREDLDLKKEKHLLGEGVYLLRIKEYEENIEKCYLSNNIIFCGKNPSDIRLNEAIKMCFDYISENITHTPCTVDINIKRDRNTIYELYIKGIEEKSFYTHFPELSKQWHPTKNLNIKPDMVKPFSDKIVWWVCKKGHEWDAPVKDRSIGRGCPYCAGKRVCADNALQTLDPELSKQWHPSKNGNFTPDIVTTGSGKKVWWQCEKGHEWEATIASRAKNGNGCPFCSGLLACADNSLRTVCPELSKQWHLVNNKDLSPDNVTTGSGKKVWWQCEKGHEWEAIIASRAKDGDGCPFCSGLRACTDNSLQTLNPELSKQWHPTKNGDLTPDEVTVGSGKKVWWQCDNGHQWETSISHRHKGSGCPYCFRINYSKHVSLEKSLQTLNPELSKQWHPTKNGDLTPDNVTTGSHKKVWWQCEKEHEWEASVKARSKGSGCPFCSGRNAHINNCLQTLNPELSKEWHPSKNGNITPNDVTAGSGKKAWWLCDKRHEWEAVIASRNNGKGCPHCHKMKSKN